MLTGGVRLDIRFLLCAKKKEAKSNYIGAIINLTDDTERVEYIVHKRRQQQEQKHELANLW